MKQTYGRKVAEVILGDYMPSLFDIRDDGIFPNLDDLEVLQWNPACDMEGADVPDPLEAPGLPIPFTAAHLAAFMLDGIGCLLPSIYGPLGDDPLEEMLSGLGIRATKAREALREAYAAYRAAESKVGSFDRALEHHMQETAEKCEEENGLANQREKVFEAGISTEEAIRRRTLARESIEKFRAAADQAKGAYGSAHAAWRKAMVQQLLGQLTTTAYQQDEAALEQKGADGLTLEQRAALHSLGKPSPFDDLLKPLPDWMNAQPNLMGSLFQHEERKHELDRIHAALPELIEKDRFHRVKQEELARLEARAEWEAERQATPQQETATSEQEEEKETASVSKRYRRVGWRDTAVFDYVVSQYKTIMPAPFKELLRILESESGSVPLRKARGGFVMTESGKNLTAKTIETDFKHVRKAAHKS